MTASRKMGFGTDLQGRASHEALLKLQDAEIKLLEMVRRLVTARVEADRQYVANLTKMVGYATKGDNSDLLEFQDCCSVFRAWDTQLKETENFIKLVKENCETMATRTLESLTFLIAEKKSVRKSYVDQRNQLDSQMLKHQEDVQKNKTDYSRLMDRLKVEQAKYQDAQNKGKAGAKLEESKTKLVRTMTRLHGQHNEYVMAVQQANAFQTSYGERILPATLNCHQSVEEVYVRLVKFVFQDYARLTDFTSEPFQEVSRQIAQSLDRVEPGNEYGSAFIGKYKSEPLDPVQFEFDSNLMEDYSGPLKAGQLGLDDLTFEALRHRRCKVEEELKADKKALELHKKRCQDLSRAVGILEQDFAQHETAELIKQLVEQRKQEEMEKKEIEILETNVLQLEPKLELISQLFTALGDASPPSAFESSTSEAAETSVETESNFSTSSKDKEKRGFKLPGKLTSVNPFRKDKANGKVKASKEDLLNSGDDVEKRNRPANGSERLGSYEQTDPVANGPAARASMAAMREDAQAMPKGRFEDEEWFHGVLPREEVQRLLVEDGDYLVRESKNRKTNETQYVLSVFWQGHKHFIIQGAEETGWRFEGASFPTIQELIEQQHSSEQPVTNKSQAILKKAILREDWELLNDHIHLEMKIGNGNFGEVYKGVYTPKNMVVAVKTCRDTLSEDQRKKFLQEGRILKQYNHPNIVSFIGIAAQRQPVMIVMEYVSGGALLSFLRKQGKQQTKRQLTQMCVDAANGMAYLESRGCIHRDLAARNCLVGENNVIKISDFGMSREEEEYTVSEGMKQIPIKWTAPEALNFGKYTMLCDVWSFGILMWEIFSSGQQPYPGMTNAQAREKIEDGYRLPQNPQTPDSVHKLMLRCWEYTPEKRPRFKDIYESLKDSVRRL